MRRGNKYRCTFWYNGSIRKLTRGFLSYEHAYQWLRQKGYSAIDVEKIGGDEQKSPAIPLTSVMGSRAKEPQNRAR